MYGREIMTVTLLLYCDYQNLNCSLDLISPVYLMVQSSSMYWYPSNHLTPYNTTYILVQLECLTMLICRDKPPSCFYIMFQIDPSPFALLNFFQTILLYHSIIVFLTSNMQMACSSLARLTSHLTEEWMFSRDGLFQFHI